MTRRLSVAVTLSVLGFICLLGLSAQTVLADDIITLGAPNSAINTYPGPYGSLDISLLNPTTADVTLTALSATVGSTAYNYLFGGSGTLGLNTNGSVSISGASETGGTLNGSTFKGTLTGCAAGGSKTEGGFGAFNLTCTNFDGFFDSGTSLTMTLTLLNGTWTSAADVLTNNGNGYLAGEHVFVESAACTDPTTGALQACATGYAANGGGGGGGGITGGGSNPEPATLTLLGTVLLGGGFLTRKKRKKLVS